MRLHIHFFFQHTEAIEVTEVKIEEDDYILEDANEGSNAEETIVHEEVLLVDDADLVDFDAEKPSNEMLSNSPFLFHDDGDDSSDYEPPSKKKQQVVVRKTFTEKPPVVTERKRRGRPKAIVPPKPLPQAA